MEDKIRDLHHVQPYKPFLLQKLEFHIPIATRLFERDSFEFCEAEG